jgi:hypothetical protein
LGVGRLIFDWESSQCLGGIYAYFFVEPHIFRTVGRGIVVDVSLERMKYERRNLALILAYGVCFCLEC